MNYLSKRGKGIGLRLGVRTSGCSGMAYKLEFVDQCAADDLCFREQWGQGLHGSKSLPYLDGMELDYAREGLNEGFKFNNPNVRISAVAVNPSMLGGVSTPLRHTIASPVTCGEPALHGDEWPSGSQM